MAAVKQQKQITAWLINKPGQLARLGRALKNAKVNVLAMSVVDSADASTVRMIVSSAPAARRALTRAQIPHNEHAVLLLDLPNEPGVMARVADTLSKAGVNLDYAYGSTHPSRDQALVVIGCDDVKRARKVLA